MNTHLFRWICLPALLSIGNPVSSEEPSKEDKMRRRLEALRSVRDRYFNAMNPELVSAAGLQPAIDAALATGYTLIARDADGAICASPTGRRRVFRVLPPELLPVPGVYQVPTDIEARLGGRSLLKALELRGITFPAGSKVTHNEDGTLLVARLTETNHKRLLTIINDIFWVYPEVELAATLVEADRYQGHPDEALSPGDFTKRLAELPDKSKTISCKSLRLGEGQFDVMESVLWNKQDADQFVGLRLKLRTP
jgi:hypothetical protein